MARVRDKHSRTWIGWEVRGANLLWWGRTGANKEDTTAEHYKWAEIDLTSGVSPPYLFHIIHVKMNFETAFSKHLLQKYIQTVRAQTDDLYASNRPTTRSAYLQTAADTECYHLCG